MTHSDVRAVITKYRIRPCGVRGNAELFKLNEVAPTSVDGPKAVSLFPLLEPARYVAVDVSVISSHIRGVFRRLVRPKSLDRCS